MTELNEIILKHDEAEGPFFRGGSSSETMSPTASGEVCARDLKAAQEAYKANDVDASKKAHSLSLHKQHHNQEEHQQQGKFIKPFVFGGLDGIVTNFAIVSGVAGAGLSTAAVLVLGFSNLFADGLSMGFGDYLSSKAEISFARAEKKREEWEYDHFIEGEKQEMIEIYTQRGMPAEDAKIVVDIMAKHKQFFLNVMMVDELGLMPVKDDENPLPDALVTFGSFCAFGTIPLLSFIITMALGSRLGASDSSLDTSSFIAAILLTLVTLFFLGFFKAKFTDQSRIKSGLSVVLNGSLAASFAYFVGWFMQSVVLPGEELCG
eukprot:GCRY01001515.1.p1 GENE.GCRY01001515.1~~GCRY01001515.1.p1  ORF type:complete len:320 (+),score=48.99 GCRY01001515.1:72-1031(+)